MDVGLVVGVIALGTLHGVLPDHGWPIAALYALDRSRKWLHGTVAALVLGTGHLVSSVALVVAYYWFSTFAAFAEGPWMKPVAGGLLVLLGLYEYASGGHEDGHGTSALGSDESEAHSRANDGIDSVERTESDDPPTGGGTAALFRTFRGYLPGGGHGHSHFEETHAKSGLRTLGATALLLGFAHEEPIQILAICAGTEFCLELMLVYSAAVIVAILVPTLLLIAGYQTHRERIEQYTPYLPTLTAVVLIGVGAGFILGLF